MKRYIIFTCLSCLLLAASCMPVRETGLSRKERAAADEAIVRQAVESRQFIIKLERLYTRRGGFYDLRPRSNYIIIDGSKAIVNAAYMGRQYDARPIGGLNIKGVAKDYEVTKKLPKGAYQIKLKVDNNGSWFDIYLTISSSGTASASVNSIRIDNIRYTGYVVPIRENVRVPLQDHEVI